MPLLVDTIDDRVGHAYSGMPDRLYVIDRAGKVAYQGGRGPFGFKSAEMEQSLIMLLLEATLPQANGKPAASRPK
jgi:Iodothyronine deiodinase